MAAVETDCLTCLFCCCSEDREELKASVNYGQDDFCYQGLQKKVMTIFQNSHVHASIAFASIKPQLLGAFQLLQSHEHSEAKALTESCARTCACACKTWIVE